MPERAHRAACTEAQGREKKKKENRKEKWKAQEGRATTGLRKRKRVAQRSKKSGSRGFALATMLRARVSSALSEIPKGKPSALQTVNQIGTERHTAFRRLNNKVHETAEQQRLYCLCWWNQIVLCHRDG